MAGGKKSVMVERVQTAGREAKARLRAADTRGWQGRLA